MAIKSSGSTVVRFVAIAALVVAGAAATRSARAAELVLAEPVHYVGFLPVYVALDQGYFKDEGIDLKISTMDGGAMVPAVVSGQAFALTASVDRNAMAKVSGKVIKAVVNLDGRANIYLVARKGLAPANGDIADFVRGKRIAVTAYGGTPNSMLRYLLTKWNLEPGKDVTLVEVNGQPLVLATMAAGQADIGVTAEPFISQGVAKGLWAEPFYAAKDLGPYADTAISVSEDSIEKQPKLVLAFVRAVMRGLQYTDSHRGEMLAFAKKEMPTASEADLKASLDRTFADGIYSTDGFIPPEAWTLGEAVVRQGGVLKADVPYDDVVDMQFVKEAQKELKPN
jgi:NitT/TauT family transport system substrate-binding protein